MAILVLNAIGHEGARARFDRRTVPRLEDLGGREVDLVHLATGEPLPPASAFSHLLISGSELSASGPGERDEEVYALVRDAVAADARILGICWGHQMIAKALAGPPVCRRAARPEFGWRHVEVRPDPLFEGVTDPVFAHSHYDELADPPPAFEILASTPDCAVQAFRYDGRPVWGVQFHPEIGYKQGRAMFKRNLAADPTIEPYLHDELERPEQLDQNESLFAAFLGAGGLGKGEDQGEGGSQGEGGVATKHAPGNTCS